MLPEIISGSNPRVKAAIRLRESRVRRKEGLFLIDGVREIERARRCGIVLREIYRDAGRSNARNSDISRSNARDSHGPQGESGESRHAEALERLTEEFRAEKISVWPVAAPLFAKMAFGDRNEGMIALAETPERSLTAFENALPEKPLLAVLEKIEKPGNIGAVFRSADGAGLDGVILADCGDDFFHPNAIRASLGTLFSIPSVSLSASETLEWLKKRGIPTASAICDAAIPYTTFDFSGPAAIALGSESDGLTTGWSDTARRPDGSASVALPMLGVADSLNISVAAAVLFYEARRQRGE